MAYKAFVSSTYVDLKDHRSRVIDALRKQGIAVDSMEDWAADSDQPKNVSVERMRDCDLCILLVGARRGHVPEGETLSITQMEIRDAEKQGIDVLAFLYDGKSAWEPEYYELDDDQELVNWRAELMEHRCIGRFTHDPASVEALVPGAIGRWAQKQAWPEVRKTYLETLRSEHSSIRFLGVGQYRDVQDRPIEELFVEPQGSIQHISPDVPLDSWPETEPLLDLVSRERRLVLLGDPGSGKSTLVSWIVWRLTDERENNWQKALGELTPIVMVLREMALDEVRTWEDLWAACCGQLTAHLLGRPRYATEVRELLESGSAMTILDGLDEVSSPGIQKSLRDAVREGMEKYDRCRWLLTSRIVGYSGYHEGPEEEEPKGRRGDKTDIAELRYVAPFNDDQVRQFGRNWFETRDASSVRADRDSAKFIDAVHSNPYTLRLARIPNLLMMMALIHRERVRLPDGRALLYTDIANAYLQSIDENRRIEGLGYSLRDQKQWLGRIGFEMQLRRHTLSGDREANQDEILVEGRDVREWVMAAMQAAGKESSEDVADEFLDQICRRSGLLLPRGEDLFAFTHLSFQEFFAAVFLLPQFMLPSRRAESAGVQGASADDLKAYTRQAVWLETLVFLVELTAAEHPEWLEELLFCLLGEDFLDLDPAHHEDLIKEPGANGGKYGAGILLARLAVDPHSGLQERGLKSGAIERCCALEMATQTAMAEKMYSNEPEILRVLFGADPDDLTLVWKALRNAVNVKGGKMLSLRSVPIEDMSALSGFTGLESLSLSGTQVSDVSALSGLTSLQELELSGTQVSDVSALSGLAGLLSLYLRETQVSDVSALSGLIGLIALDLGGTKVSDVSALSGLTGLQGLSLQETHMSDVSALSGLIGLKTLDLVGTQMSDVSALSGLTGLEWLDLNETQVSDVSALSGLTGLQRLDLYGTKVRDVSVLSGLTGLQRLNLHETKVRDVSALSGLTGLEWLDLQATQVSDNEVKRLREALPECIILH